MRHAGMTGGRRSGQTMVEFALGLPVLLALLIGLLEMGRMVMSYTLVGHAAREGARYGAMTTVISPPPLPGTPPVGTDPIRPTWWQPCNIGQDDSQSPGYVEYLATDSTCAGWPNIVSTVAYGGTGTSLSDMRVRISYDQDPPPSPGSNPLEVSNNRGVPLKVTVRYTHRPLFAQFLNLPATVPIEITATTLTQ